MKIKKFLNNSNNNLLNSFCLESGTNVFKDHVPITTLKENNKKKVFYSYNIIDGYKYKIIVKRKKNNLNNTKFIISSLDHPYIVKLIHCCEYSSCYISVFEFFSDITLYSSVIFSTKYDERKIKNIIYQIFLTVNYLHSNNLFHKNLAPYSFLIKIVNNEVMIKLEDVYNIKALSTKLNSKMKSENIYSIGVIMYFLACGKYPHFCFENKKKKVLPLNELHENISHKGQSFLRRILLSDLSSMITIREALDHEWFKENVKKNIYINFDMLRSIYDFWKKNTFKRYILNNISKFMVKEDIYKYNFLFFYFDLLEEGSIKYEQYSSTMKKLGLIDANVQESFNGLDVSERGQIQFSNIIACLLNNFIKIDKKVVFKFFKKVDYNNEGIITKKKLYKFYNITTKSDLSVNDKRKFNFEDFYSYISKE
ncbi:protein kinase [Plasmodium brasilianum]|uniref:Protein kinase, putative n=2 Tax=Plasmodium (Plasmodium) TaxID=418103 RepID=A0A1D3SNN5_PLAMA|nr:protein kinase, putative [Plasmodium malariae]KAI4836271.1 protein kinase [Plasmodium brasilianum]SCO93536.1 protein kinase, putative [Plasmodium malariae]